MFAVGLVPSSSWPSQILFTFFLNIDLMSVQLVRVVKLQLSISTGTGGDPSGPHTTFNRKKKIETSFLPVIQQLVGLQIVCFFSWLTVYHPEQTVGICVKIQPSNGKQQFLDLHTHLLKTQMGLEAAF